MLVTAIDLGVDQARSLEQKKNYESLIQSLQLKTQIEPMLTVVTTNNKMDNVFNIKKTDPVWVFCFAVEQIDYFDLDSINSDINYIPCILDLSESSSIKQPLFITDGKDKNTMIKSYQLNN